jgi:hypothetical protein
VRKETERLAGDHENERVWLVVIPGSEIEAPKPTSVDDPFYTRASPEEFIAALDALAIRKKDLPALPPEAFERESIYEDRW